VIEIGGKGYWVVIGSDVDQDGMFLEVQDAADVLIARIFYWDRDASMTFTSFRDDVPLALVEWMTIEAKKRLVPSASHLPDDPLVNAR
jgi:hypothetical protein